MSEGINTTTPGGKLVYHVFAAVAEFHRDIIVENTIEGLNAARRHGRRLGRPDSLSPDAIAAVHSAMMQDGRSKADLAQMFGVSEITIDRAFRRVGFSDANNEQASKA